MSLPVGCEDLAAAPADIEPISKGCVDCEALGRDDWVHLRLCLACGHVGCCDSSPLKHASAHYAASEHPVMRSFEPGEDWRWCFKHFQIG
jgi:CPA1 family monovalent cation:H+ antiporter